MEQSYNYLAILTSAVVSYIFGLLWFTMLFAKPYIHDLGKTKAQMDKGPSMIAASVIQVAGFAAMAFVLSWLVQQLGYTSVSQAIRLAFIVWVGFVAAIIGPMYAFQAFSFRLFLINAVGYLVSILTCSIIVTLWR